MSSSLITEFSQRECTEHEEARSPTSPGSDTSSSCDGRDRFLCHKTPSVVDSVLCGSDSRYQSPARSRPVNIISEGEQRTLVASKLCSARSTEALLGRRHMGDLVQRSISEPLTDGLPEQNRRKSGPTASEPVTGLKNTSDNNNVPRSPQKRGFSSQSYEKGEEGTPSHLNYSGSKRRKIETKADNRDCFPCIFHVGEPTVYPAHTKRYDYVSQLLRHLKSHEFYACSKCFSRFETPEEQELHNHSPCYKACRSRKCTRHIKLGAEPPTVCKCITRAEDQWNELYRLQYPDSLTAKRLDTRHEQMSQTEAEPNIGASHVCKRVLTVQNSQNGCVSSRLPMREHAGQRLFESARDLTRASREQHFAEVSPSGVAPVSDTQHSETQSLREKIQTLEQQLARIKGVSSPPNSREEDLELLLANVWEALSRSESPEAQPNSAVWRLVKRFAPTLLGSSSEAAIMG